MPGSRARTVDAGVDRRPVLLLPAHPPWGIPLAPGANASHVLAAWAHGNINRPDKSGNGRTIGYYWKTTPFTHATIHDVFDVQCILPPGQRAVVQDNYRIGRMRLALRRLVDHLEGRVVVLCGRGVDRVMHGPRDRAPYGAVRLLDLNARILLPTEQSLIEAGETRGRKHNRTNRERPIRWCTTVLAPNPSPRNLRYVAATSQITRIEFGMIYRAALTLEHRPPTAPPVPW